MKLLHLSLFSLPLILAGLGCRQQPSGAGQQPAARPDSSWVMLGFEKADANNPVLGPVDTLRFRCPIRGTEVNWAEKDVFNPATVVRNDSLFLIYRAEDVVGRFAGTSRLGLAVSTDGLVFYRYPEPILYPDEDSLKRWEWEGGVEDPRIVESEDGRYIMTYTAYDGDKARLFVASSDGLFHWRKHGSAFGGSKYRDMWSKSGAIASRRKGGRLVAEKINGKYWMYWGDKNIHLATSDDLIRWQALEDEKGELKTILPFRPGYFDSDLVEPGPPALITDAGILLIYNGRNFGPVMAPGLPEGTYSAGQALFDAGNPQNLIQRLEHHFFHPEKPYEITGQVNNVVFLEGLAFFKGKWFLYYGTADSRIAVAVRGA